MGVGEVKNKWYENVHNPVGLSGLGGNKIRTYALFKSIFEAESLIHPSVNIMKTRLFKYIENFTTKKENFLIKKSDIFHISA